MSYPVYFVNAFTEEYYKGNTAAVVIMEEFEQDSSLQALAREFGFSETAFVKRLGFGRYHLRWFTPETEVNLCGHATLATAKVLFTDIIPHDRLIIFQTRSGELLAKREKDVIHLDFPVDNPQKIETDNKMLKAISKANAVEVLYAAKTKNLVVVYQDAETVRSLKPDFSGLEQLQSEAIFGIAVTAQGEGIFDYICRYFAPWEGILEDPVTGSAQTCLAPYWCEKLLKLELKGYQASERGGFFDIKLIDDRVQISGKSFIYLKGELKRGF